MFFRQMFHIIAALSCVGIPLQSMEFLEPSIIMGPDVSASERLSNLFDQFFQDMQKLHPEFGTYTGLSKAYNGIWTDHTEDGYFSRYRFHEECLNTLHSIDKQALSLTEQLNYELFEMDLNSVLESYVYETFYMPVDQLSGIPMDVESTLGMMPKVSEEDYGNMISRLSAIPDLIDQTIALLNGGLDKGVTPPQVALRSLPESIAKMTPSSIANSVFFQPFQSFPESFEKALQDQLTGQALSIIEELVYPAYRKLYDYLVGVYLPGCRQTIGASDLPNGANYYRYCVKKHTTTHLSPLEIHQIGLDEVDRIHREMQKIINEIDFSGSIADFFQYLNTSPEFFYTEPESLIIGYQAITRYIDGQLPLLFGRLPKLPYEVLPVPEYAEAGQVGAYYMRGSLATGRPGRFYANTYDIGSRPKWQMESLSLHEAVPGHHFQISLAQEIEGLPEFRKYNGYTAYIEGWGLYSESLGKELGLYKAPSDQFGRLIEEVWRAVRLVVDTGMHALGWGREEAIAYMLEKTGMNEREVTTEIDRYIVWPGQALAYKIGELSIQKWRRESEEAIGDSFDIRAFHDKLLEQGALPLDICEKYMHDWIDSQKNAGDS